jgi:hypothetical protein
MIRPVPMSVPSTVTSADSAAANGAIRCGAGISSQKISGRSRAARMVATAAAELRRLGARTRARVVS